MVFPDLPVSERLHVDRALGSRLAPVHPSMTEGSCTRVLASSALCFIPRDKILQRSLICQISLGKC